MCAHVHACTMHICVGFYIPAHVCARNVDACTLHVHMHMSVHACVRACTRIDLHACAYNSSFTERDFELPPMTPM